MQESESLRIQAESERKWQVILEDFKQLNHAQQKSHLAYLKKHHENKQTGWELVDGKHKAIISRDTYEINQRLLYGKRKRAGEVRQKFNPDYPLKGLVLYPNCMKPLYASAPKTGAGGKSPRYHCSRPLCKGKYKSIKADVMHDDFEKMLQRIKPDDKLLALYKEVLIAETANQLGSLNSKISRARSQLDTIAENRLNAIKKSSNCQ